MEAESLNLYSIFKISFHYFKRAVFSWSSVEKVLILLLVEKDNISINRKESFKNTSGDEYHNRSSVAKTNKLFL